jgi:hypothetical protein
MRPQRFAAARTVGKSQVPGSVALATTSRRVSRPFFCGENDVAGVAGVAARPCWTFPVWGRLGTLAAASATPQAKPTAGEEPMHRDRTVVLFLSGTEGQKLRFRGGKDHSAALRGPSRPRPRGPPQKNKNTERACRDPLPPLPLSSGRQR